MELRADAGPRPRGELRRPLEVPGHLLGTAIGMTDRAGRALALGGSVLLQGGEHAGHIGEVVGCGGRRGVEVVVHGPRPAFLAVSPALVELVDAVLLDPIARRPRRGQSAPAGGRWQAQDGAAGIAQPGRLRSGGPSAAPAGDRYDQHPGLRRASRPQGRREPGPA